MRQSRLRLLLIGIAAMALMITGCPPIPDGGSNPTPAPTPSPEPTPAPTPTSYTLTYLAAEHGSIEGTTPQTVDPGADGSPVTAVPATGYEFICWKPDNSTANPRQDLDVSTNITATAYFALIGQEYTLTYTAGTNGSITGSLSQTVPAGGNGTTVTAVPASDGYHFVSWSDGLTTASRTDSSVVGDISVTATFAANGSASIVFSGPVDEEIDLSTNPDFILDKSEYDSLTVTVSGAYDSYYWLMNGDETYSASATYTINAAYYDPDIYTLTAIVDDDGSYYSKQLRFSVVR